MTVRKLSIRLFDSDQQISWRRRGGRYCGSTAVDRLESGDGAGGRSASGSVSRCDGNRPDAAARRPVVDSVGFDGSPPSAILRRDESRRDRPADGRGRTAEPRGGDGPVRIGLCGPPDGSGGCDKSRRGRIFDLVDEGAGDRQRSFRPDALFSLGTSRLQCDRRET